MDAGALAGGFQHASRLSDLVAVRAKPSDNIFRRAWDVRESHGHTWRAFLS